MQHGRQHRRRRLDAEQVRRPVDHGRVAGPAHHVPLGPQDLPGLLVLAADHHEDAPGKAGLIRTPSELTTSTRPVPWRMPPISVGTRFRNTEAQALDLDNRRVVTAAGDLEYDSLVVSLGAELAPGTVSGFDEMALNPFSPAGCSDIHAALQAFTEGVVAVLIPALPFKCPAAPYEAAFLAESFLPQEGHSAKR